jgi:hypothetical protein
VGGGGGGGAPAPSPMTKPSRLLSQGREALSGLSFLLERALQAMKPPIPDGMTAASAPPASIRSASPLRMCSAALQPKSGFILPTEIVVWWTILPVATSRGDRCALWRCKRSYLLMMPSLLDLQSAILEAATMKEIVRLSKLSPPIPSNAVGRWLAPSESSFPYIEP